MYQKYSENQGWKFEILESNVTEIGGIKEVSVMISGNSVYSKLKYESGAHRVQRVPKTETQGRVHTSTATVLVMPEIEDFDINIDPKDLRIDIYHASGAGGQNVNKVATAVRMVHVPTGIKVEMQEERNQQKNRDKAMKIINARVYDHFAQIERNEENLTPRGLAGRAPRWSAAVRLRVVSLEQCLAEGRAGGAAGNSSQPRSSVHQRCAGNPAAGRQSADREWRHGCRNRGSGPGWPDFRWLHAPGQRGQQLPAGRPGAGWRQSGAGGQP